MGRAGDAARDRAGQRRGFGAGQQADIIVAQALQPVQLPLQSVAPPGERRVANIAAEPHVRANVAIGPPGGFESSIAYAYKIRVRSAPRGEWGAAGGQKGQGEGGSLQELAPRGLECLHGREIK